MIPIMTNTRVISSAWADTLSMFVQNTREELLLMSPWITSTVANLISYNLVEAGPVKLQILSRLDEVDFLRGSSHVNAFKATLYPASTYLEIRALPMLHGKMLISDRNRVLIGSANLTEGGLHRNHEVSLLVESPELGSECAKVFFKYWDIATPLPTDYLNQVESALSELLPDSDEGSSRTTSKRKPSFSEPKQRSTRFKYKRPDGAAVASQHLSQLLHTDSYSDVAPEVSQQALFWLSKTHRFLSKEARRSEAVVKRLELLMCHPNFEVRAMAVDRAGRSGDVAFLNRLSALVTNPTEDGRIRSAAAFSLGVIGSPEALPTLTPFLFDNNNDLRRWARRGCFLMLNLVDQDEISWILNELEVEHPGASWHLANRCNMDIGTVSERLTKALVIEKLATKEWSSIDVTSLVYIMKHLSLALRSNKKIPHLSLINKISADALGVAQGDLRHGPFSPTLLRRMSKSGFSDSGLNILLGPDWQLVQMEDTQLVASILDNPKIGSLFQFLE